MPLKRGIQLQISQNRTATTINWWHSGLSCLLSSESSLNFMLGESLRTKSSVRYSSKYNWGRKTVCEYIWFLNSYHLGQPIATILLLQTHCNVYIHICKVRINWILCGLTVWLGYCHWMTSTAPAGLEIWNLAVQHAVYVIWIWRLRNQQCCIHPKYWQNYWICTACTGVYIATCISDNILWVSGVQAPHQFLIKLESYT